MMNSKKMILESINEEYYSEFNTHDVVFGCGNVDSKIVFVGEAPGKDEIKKKEPFVGKAGEKFSQILDILDLNRNEIYVTNAIKFGLRKINPDTGRHSNRPAKKQEMLSNRPYLLKELRCIDPILVVTMGSVPLKTLLGKYDLAITSYTGEILEIEDLRIFPLLHPAALIYNPYLIGIFNDNLEKLKLIICNRCK